tara:strand:+ start:576 stop:1610 length:1035 start_codon:yes stop_codon:yes gene_type:complete
MATIAASARYGTGVYGSSSYGIVNLSVTLTGISATGSVNNVTEHVTEVLTSVSSTGSLGTLKVNVVESISGVSATTNTNTVIATGKAKTVLTGVGATGQTRTLHLDIFEVDITEPIYNAPTATGSVGGLTLHTTAGITSVGLTGTVNSVGAGVSVPLTVSVEGVVSTNTVKENVDVVPEDSVATFTINSTGLNIRSVNRVPITGAAMVGSIGTPEVQATENLLSVSATAQVGSIQVNLVEKVSGVAATSSVNDAFEFSNTHRVTNTGTEFTVGVISPNVDKPIPTAGFSTASVGTLKVNTAGEQTGSEATGQVGTVTTTAVVFNFEAVKNLYSKRRTVIIPRAA